ncbi:MAG TPA: hypothetical protein VF656_10555 [Pyrinomonadaceae bacterium]|jgi:hypothetical protein
MREEKYLNSVGFGFAYIEAGIVSCFSRADLIVEMKFSEAGKVAANIVRDEIMQTVFLERAEAENFLSRILEAAQKPEVLSDTRSTTRYYAKARWKNLGFVAGGLMGSIDVKSSELPTEEIERFLADLKDAAKIQEVRGLLARGLHRRAIEIHREVEAFAKAKSYVERSRE